MWACNLLKSFLQSILVPIAIVLSYNMVLTITSKPTFYHCLYLIIGLIASYSRLPSVLWCCWLGGRKGIRSVKTEWWGAGVVICLERGADLHMAQLMPLPLTVSCFNKIEIGFNFLVLAHPGSSCKMAVKWVCVWSHVYVFVHCAVVFYVFTFLCFM